MAVDVAPGGSLCTCSESGETDDVRPMTGQASGFCLRLRRPASGLRTTMSFYLSSACSKICMCTHSDYYLAEYRDAPHARHDSPCKPVCL